MTVLRRLWFVAVLVVGVNVSGGSVSAQERPPSATSRPAPGSAIRVDVGRSTVVQAPWPARRVSVTNPDIADVEVLTPNQVLLMGKSIGTTDLVMWSEGQEAWQARVDVDIDLPRLKGELSKLFPVTTVDITRSENVVVLTGSLGRAEQAEHLHRYLDATGLKYVDMTSVAGVHQVEIQVRVAEASRTALRELGVNTLQAGSDYFGATAPGPSTGGALVPISMGPPEGAAAGPNIPFEFTNEVVTSPLVTLIAGFPRADLEFFVRALAENGYLQILAEPNLTALSGEEASFLAGGEFPIPVVQGGLGGTAASITIEYKEFGVQLAFRPVVLGDGTIRLEIGTEVSDITDRGAVEIQGFRVPAIITRRVDTTLELKSGQLFGMAGLLQTRDEARNSRLPGIGDLPILGALFRSVRYERGETELVVLVRASVVEPISIASATPVPGDAHVPPNDAELYFGGRLEGKPPKNVPPPERTWLRDRGLDSLKGPGMWQRHGDPNVPNRSNLKTAVSTEPAAPEPGDRAGQESPSASGPHGSDGG